MRLKHRNEERHDLGFDQVVLHRSHALVSTRQRPRHERPRSSSTRRLTASDDETRATTAAAVTRTFEYSIHDAGQVWHGFVDIGY